MPAPQKLLAAAISAVLAAGVVSVSSHAYAAEEDTVVVDDAMNRNVLDGLGTAAVGGAYTLSNPAAVSVNGSQASFAIPGPGQSITATLDELNVVNIRGSQKITLPELPTSGSGIYVGTRARVSGTDYYHIQALIQPDGKIQLVAQRSADGSTTTVADTSLSNTVAKPGEPLVLDYEVTGTDSVSVKARIYEDGSTTPDWQLNATDSSSSRITSPGSLSLWTYASSSTPGQTVLIDDVLASDIAEVSQPTVVEPPKKTETSEETEPPGEETPKPKESTEETNKTIISTNDSTAVINGSTTTTAWSTAGARKAVGAATVGTTSYTIPSGAIFVKAGAASGGNGTSAKPYDSIQTAVDASNSGATIVLRAGFYHQSIEVPKGKKLTIQAYPKEAVWLDGSSKLANWTSSNGKWYASGWANNFDASPGFTKGIKDGTAAAWQWLNPSYPMAAHPEQVWIDGVAQREVGSLAEVKAGTFFTDTANKRLYIGSNPSGRTVTASDIQKAVSLRGDGTVLRGIGIRNFAPSIWMMGAITAEANNLVIENVIVEKSSSIGIWISASDVTVRKVTLAGNGLLGMGVSQGDRAVLDSVLVAENNTENFNTAPVAGGVKVTRTRTVTVKDSAFLRNRGTGLWFDESSYDITVTGCDSIENAKHGISFEISNKVDVINNLILRNQGHGVKINNTGSVRFWNNTISGGDRTINVVQDNRDASNASTPGHDPRRPVPDSTMPWLIKNVSIRNNVFEASTGNCTLCSEDYSKRYSASQLNLSSQSNILQRTKASSPNWLVVWPGTSGKPGVYTTLSAFSNATGQDKNSTSVDGQRVTNDAGRLIGPGAAAANKGEAMPADIAKLAGVATGSKNIGAIFP